ncbi:hypothetical protein [Bacillus sp. 3255]|uniref:DNA-3-methyladenine glycosylase family protein n=1 Tax=Bacillus sp. 3255 TaxID=2817904 RepID=UPI002864297B|nr:hypothetical protein [Bacillus sp. 3255]MDR6883413.1 3-methyladenine DNA glycosylase/8-oxoguanine DNA glycosylase [Bacillus sp. 3255]
MSIISQQLSAKAAATIKARVKLAVPEFTPEQVLAADEAAIRQCGVSFPKIRYIRDLSSKVIAGELRLDNLRELDNEELLRQLTGVKGIGVWTAEMFMIFALGRADVMSVGDAGLQRAARWLHQLDERKDGNYLGQIAPQFRFSVPVAGGGPRLRRLRPADRAADLTLGGFGRCKAVVARFVLRHATSCCIQAPAASSARRLAC